MKCKVKRCRNFFLLLYAAFGARRTKEVPVCQQHWDRHCDDEDEFDLVEHFYPKEGEQHDKG